MTEVAIARQEDYSPIELRSQLEKMLADISILDSFRGADVLIKPNCTGYCSPDEGRTTHPAVVKALVELLRKYDAFVRIGESSSTNLNTQMVYDVTGITHVARELSVPLIDFKKSTNIVFGKHYSLPEELLESDCLISVGKMKTNYVTTISCAMKNLKGLLPDHQKVECHRNGLSQSLVELYSTVQSELRCVALVDGILGSELYRPRPAHVLVASEDFIACDAVCANVMGVDADKVEHLRLASYLGERDIAKMQIHGRLFSVAPPFRSTPPGLESMAEEFGVEIIDGKPCSSCIGGLYYILGKLKKQRPEMLKGLRIAIGNCEGFDLSGAILFGNCSYNQNSESAPGCPPTTADFAKAVMRLTY
jgi:uncharacterized protein (DUF362 family)